MAGSHNTGQTLPGLPTTSSLRRILERDVCDFVLNNMTYRREYRSTLIQKSAGDLLLMYLNWRSRQIDPRPRTVHKSAALLANRHMASSRYARTVTTIERQLQSGGNLNIHLSDRILDGYQPPRPGKLTQRRDLDMLLNDWGLHHLHLSTVLTPKGFSGRTGPLLIAAIKPDHAYLVDIIEHGGWTSDHLVRIMVEEWPDAELVRRMNGVTPDNMTAGDRKKLRDSGINVSVNIDGEAYHVGTYSTAGWSFWVQREADSIMLKIDQFCKQMEADPRFAAKLLATKNVLLPLDCDFHFEVFPEGGYGVVERRTGYRIRLDA